MESIPVVGKRVNLVPQTRDDVREEIEQMQPDEKAQLSAEWLALLEGSTPADPWIHGFLVKDASSKKVLGRCGFKGPPGSDGAVEIAYFVAPEERGKGYASEAAETMVAYAFARGNVTVVRAHTLPEPNASTRVLTKCGFRRIGEVMDPEDGLVWRWEKSRA